MHPEYPRSVYLPRSGFLVGYDPDHHSAFVAHTGGETIHLPSEVLNQLALFQREKSQARHQAQRDYNDRTAGGVLPDESEAQRDFQDRHGS